ncbi:MAG: bifunctional adenosylcobinamide kinase/adenosylcobinamide-phosphate guanylyltransferase [Lachnospiraceae bacterium]|nr:bifunctional adenosylcobinamide kinase/adenosylcobinamide-phosphate guanylyltransferase [Lachnospiraceae bacterium]MDE6627095.1 bifunctional adenosylcobinamide kinase/adenosylcobinamide-phosphate guanylyltransferase [Lachnospiraceae bacterium]
MILIIGGAYQGKAEYASSHFAPQYKIIDKYHLTVRKQMECGQDPFVEAKKLLEEDNLVIISDEIGCGLVPVEASLREYREIAGRINCYLASEAEQVIRVICGIGQRIK